MADAARDERGRWRAGGPSPNPAGRPGGTAQFRRQAREHQSEALSAVLSVLNDPAAKHSDRLRAAALLAEWGFGSLGTVVADDAEGLPMPDLSVFFPVRTATPTEDSDE